MSQVDGFNEPVHGTRNSRFAEGLKDGPQEHRILPPIAKLDKESSGKYIRFHACHYGYGTKMSGSDKEFPNPFYCVEEGKFIAGKFVVLVECPECQEIRRVRSQKDDVEKSMKKENASDAAIAQAIESHAKWLNKHNKDPKYYVNVKGADGRYFTVKYPTKKVWSVIEGLITEYKNKRVPIDAIAASQGLWFRITRSGKGFKTEYKVEVVTEDVIVNGQVLESAQKPKLAPLTNEDAKKAGENCLDLSDVGIRRLSIEQVQRLVASRGDPAVIQAVFAGSDDLRSTPAEADEASPEPTPASTTAPATQPTPPQAPAATQTITIPVLAAQVPVTAPPTNTDAAALIAQARALMEQAKAIAATTTTQTAPAVAPPPAPTAPAPVVAKPAPAPVAAPPTAPAVTGDSAAEAAFLDQFKFPAS